MLPVEKAMTLSNVVILFKSVLNEYKNNYYYYYFYRNVHINNINMINYDRNDVSEEIDVNQNKWTERMWCLSLWVFFRKRF